MVLQKKTKVNVTINCTEYNKYTAELEKKIIHTFDLVIAVYFPF